MPKTAKTTNNYCSNKWWEETKRFMKQSKKQIKSYQQTIAQITNPFPAYKQTSSRSSTNPSINYNTVKTSISTVQTFIFRNKPTLKDTIRKYCYKRIIMMKIMKFIYYLKCKRWNLNWKLS